MSRSSVERTRSTIQRYLLRYGTRTVPQIVKATGLSYNTVKYVLNEMHAEQVPDSYPQQYRLGNAQMAEGVMPRLLSDTQGDIDIVLSVPTHDEWINRWNSARIAFTKSIGILAIDPDDDPAERAKAFAVGAQSLAGLAYALQQVADTPDWYEALGGLHDEEA